MDDETARSRIRQLYDQGATLDTILQEMGTDPAMLAMVGSMLGYTTAPGGKLDYAAQRVDDQRRAQEQGRPISMSDARNWGRFAAGRALRTGEPMEAGRQRFMDRFGLSLEDPEVASWTEGYQSRGDQIISSILWK